MEAVSKQRGFEVVSSYAARGIAPPERKTARSAGYDIAAAAAAELAPGRVTLVPTGLKAYMRPDEYLGVQIRSGFAIKNAVSLINGQGIIDADYYNNADNEGHIMIAFFNHGARPVTVARGERIAQGIFYRYLTADGDAADAVRAGGFGSTGK